MLNFKALIIVKTRFLFILLCISLASFLSCEEDDGYKSYDEILLTETTFGSNTTYYEYNEQGQVIKATTSNKHLYSEFEYDDLDRLIKSSVYYGSYYPEYENQLTSYDTLVYEDSKIIQTNYDDVIIEGDFELAYYFEYLLNSKNECTELTVYDNDGAKMEYTTYVWSKGNIKELSWHNNNNFYWKIEYIYDNEYNPYKLLTCRIYPNDQTKNNRIKATITYHNDSVKVNNYKYNYNAYGFPTRQERMNENYIYEFKYEIN